MVKSFGLLVRRPDVTEEQFHRHWATVHRELALRISTLRRYVQFHVEGNRNVAGFPSADVDGIAETWWDDRGALMSLAANPQYADHAGVDEANFIDVTRKGGVLTTERVRIAGEHFFESAPELKAILLLKGRVGASDEEIEGFVDGPWTEQVAGIARVVRHVDALGAGGPDESRRAYDVVTELWFGATADFDAATDDLMALARRSAGSPIHLERSASVVGRELRALWPENS